MATTAQAGGIPDVTICQPYYPSWMVDMVPLAPIDDARAKVGGDSAFSFGAKWQGKDVDSLARKATAGAKLSSFVARFDSMDPDTAYAVAGSFVNSLIKTHGIAKVAEFFRACGPTATNPAVAFARTFGQSLDEAGAAWAASL